MSVRPLGGVRSDREFAVGCARVHASNEANEASSVTIPGGDDSGSGSGSGNDNDNDGDGDARRRPRESSDDRWWIGGRRRRIWRGRSWPPARRSFGRNATRGIMRRVRHDVARCRTTTTTRRRRRYDDGATSSGRASARALLPPQQQQQQRNYVRVRFRDHVVSAV